MVCTIVWIWLVPPSHHHRPRCLLLLLPLAPAGAVARRKCKNEKPEYGANLCQPTWVWCQPFFSASLQPPPLPLPLASPICLCWGSGTVMIMIVIAMPERKHFLNRSCSLRQNINYTMIGWYDNERLQCDARNWVGGSPNGASQIWSAPWGEYH